MDPESEKQLAALIMEEAKRLRLQADREGVHVYLEKPNVRGRPNSQFLTATVRSVQQANRMAEVNEMWRLREKELELEKRMLGCKYSSEHHRSSKSESLRHNSEDWVNSKHIASTSSKEVEGNGNEFSGSENADSPKMSEFSERHQHYSAKRKKAHRDEIDSVESEDSFHDNEMSGGLGDEGLLDEEVDDFLRSRAKRGRGAVGSRMDETGPYLIPHEGKSSSKVLSDMRLKEDWEQRIIGPSMPPFTKVDGCVADLEKLKRKKSKHEERRDRAKQDLKMHKDTGREIRSTKSKKKHEKRNKSEKKGKKEKRKWKQRDG